MWFRLVGEQIVYEVLASSPPIRAFFVFSDISINAAVIDFRHRSASGLIDDVDFADSGELDSVVFEMPDLGTDIKFRVEGHILYFLWV